MSRYNLYRRETTYKMLTVTALEFTQTRRALGLTQEEFAILLGFSRAAIARAEANGPSRIVLSTLQLLKLKGLVIPELSAPKPRRPENINGDFYAFLAGSLLGDGGIQKKGMRAYYQEGASDAHKDYLQWKRDFLNECVCCGELYVINTRLKETGKVYRGWRFSSKASSVFWSMRETWYPAGKKSVPITFIEEYFNELSFSVWFCDDGSQALTNQAYLHTHSFSVPEVEFLVQIVKDKIAIEGKVGRHSSGRPIIRFEASQWAKIEDAIRPFSPPGMEYKYLKRPNDFLRPATSLGALTGSEKRRDKLKMRKTLGLLHSSLTD